MRKTQNKIEKDPETRSLYTSRSKPSNVPARRRSRRAGSSGRSRVRAVSGLRRASRRTQLVASTLLSRRRAVFRGVPLPLQMGGQARSAARTGAQSVIAVLLLLGTTAAIEMHGMPGSEQQRVDRSGRCRARSDGMQRVTSCYSQNEHSAALLSSVCRDRTGAAANA